MNAEYENVSSLSPSDIAMIKVFQGNFVGSTGGGSAIAIYTRRGDMQSKNSQPSLFTNKIAGYKKLPAFFAPDYAAGLNNDVNDERVVLFRRTLPKMDAATGKIPVAFYNNDPAKMFRIVVTGFSKEGSVVYYNTIVK
jgi:hypothetical protein